MRAFWLAFVLLAQAAAGPQVRTGVLTGVIRNADGSPASNVRVTAATGLGGSSAAYLSIGESDETGRYRLEEIPPGRYFIVAGRIDLPTFYPGTTDVSEARPVSIAAGAVVADVNFTIDPDSVRSPTPASRLAQGGVSATNPMRTVSGQFVVEGRPTDPTVVLPFGNARAQHITTGFTVSAGSDASGAFSFRLEDGDYRVSVTPPRGYSVKSVLIESTDLTLQVLKVDSTFLPSSGFGNSRLRVQPLQFSGTRPASGRKIVVTLVVQAIARVWPALTSSGLR